MPRWPPIRLVHRHRNADGQASIELIAVLPILAAAFLLVVQAALVGWALLGAVRAADAGAVAMARGADPVAAARAALPGPLRPDARVRAGSGAGAPPTATETRPADELVAAGGRPPSAFAPTGPVGPRAIRIEVHPPWLIPGVAAPTLSVEAAGP